MTEAERSNLVAQLRLHGRGAEEWRVADPVTSSYCMSFSRHDYSDPKRLAAEWLHNHRTQFPDSRISRFDVMCVINQSDSQLLMSQAANEIERLQKEVKTL